MTIAVHDHGSIHHVVIQRSALRNAVDRATAACLFQSFCEFESSQTARVAVLSGEGHHFCAGADLKAAASGEPNRLKVDGSGPMGPTRLSLTKPVIAAIEGFAVAGGLELALWADLRVAAADAKLGVLCRRVGVPLIDGGTVRLPRLIGESRALDLVLTGRLVSAMEARDMGLVNRVVPPGQAVTHAMEMAEDLANFPQACLRADRASVLAQAGLPLEEALDQEFQGAEEALRTEALRGAQRFANGEGRHGRSLGPETDK
ncbi:MAG: crotonase/enoyl-CoA hydratase family protein [Myxococcota bacterium]|nr:crotonase/enoyl-CoA hydratase family protein [Myxococcota bacterium]